MFLTILGCSGPFPSAGGSTSGYLVESEGKTVLMDCGSGIFSRLTERMNPADLEAVCLSHLHYDHMSDLLVMQYYLQSAGKVMPLYVPPEDHSAVRKLLDNPCYRLFDYGDTQKIGPFTIETHPTKHPVPCRALRLTDGKSTLVYTGDAAEGESLVDFCADADVLVADAAFMESQWHEGLPHMSALQAGRLAKCAKVKKLIITHFPPSGIPRLLLEEARSVFADTDMAVSGWRMKI